MQSYLTDKMGIKKDGELYLMKMEPIPNKGFGSHESVFELKEGKLVGNDGIVYYLESSGHLRTGGSDWE